MKRLNDLSWRSRTGDRVHTRQGRPGLARALAAVEEARIGLAVKPVRTLLMAVGTVIGVAALVAATGFADSARVAVQSRFLALQSREVVVTDSEPVAGQLSYPLSAARGLYGLRGVQAAGLLFAVSTSVSAGVRQSYVSPESSASVLAGTAGILPAVGARYSWGGGLQNWMLRARADTVVLGRIAARELHVVEGQPTTAVLIDGIPFTVVGVVASVVTEPELLGDVLIPASTALALWGAPSHGIEAVIRTQPGESQAVAAEAPLALMPSDPSRLLAVGATGTLGIASSVNGDVSGLATVIGVVTLIIGAVGIAVAMLLSVVERVFEIGLRRAMGATRAEIAIQFVAEAVAIGVVGAVIGTAIGVIAIVAVADAKGWQPVAQPAVLVLAPLGGAAVGLIAGIYPAARAARLEPVDALRR